MLDLIIINSLVCFGARFAFSEVLSFIPRTYLYLVHPVKTIRAMWFFLMWGDVGSRYARIYIIPKQLDGLRYYISKPLFNCTACMSSVWGLGLWWVTGQPWGVETGIHILAVAGLTTVIILLVDG